MRDKEQKFIKEVTPVVLKLAKRWFPPDKKTPDGKYHYACTYCDQNCSQHDKHDDDCLYQLAKNTKEEWDKIEVSDKWNKSPVTGKKRLKKDTRLMKDWARKRAFFKEFLKFPSQFVPLDYNDPENKNVVCTCFIFSKIDWKKRRHAKECPYIPIARALSELYRVS